MMQVENIELRAPNSLSPGFAIEFCEPKCIYLMVHYCAGVKSEGESEGMCPAAMTHGVCAFVHYY